MKVAYSIVKDCPLCGAMLRSHCNPYPKHQQFSHTCDLVKCVGCRAVGSLDGRYWKRPDARFESIRRVADQLRADAEDELS